MTLVETAVAGTMESSDIMITLSPRAESGIAIELTSTVVKQFGSQIRREIESTLAELGVSSAAVTAVDKGAMDCTIRARVRTAARRAAKMANYPWLQKGGNA
jgi:citrate lyase subunit gamma (acyl carrier protein)